eukprot:scaffold2623_cov250-Pinguiococcus_pyrenoidosus.AAC.5
MATAIWPGSQLWLFGSGFTGLSLPSSDLDVVINGASGDALSMYVVPRPHASCVASDAAEGRSEEARKRQEPLNSSSNSHVLQILGRDPADGHREPHAGHSTGQGAHHQDHPRAHRHRRGHQLQSERWAPVVSTSAASAACLSRRSTAHHDAEAPSEAEGPE